MSHAPEELKYTESHEWVRREEDGTVTVGISDHAQEALGDVVFVELPEIDAALAAREEVAVIESVKAASDIYAPVSGTIVAVNELLEDAPETVNEEPYNEGWIFRLKLDDPDEVDALMSADDYQTLCEED